MTSRVHKWNTSFFVLSWRIWPFINRVSQIPPEKSQKRTSYRKSDKRACLQSETRTLNIIITFLWSPCTGRYYEILCSGSLINKSETKYVLEVHIVQFLQESIVSNVLLKKKRKNCEWSSSNCVGLIFFLTCTWECRTHNSTNKTFRKKQILRISQYCSLSPSLL